MSLPILPADPAEFRLLRMILLDSYSPGGEVVITLRDGAILTGENGSGKTSLIRLVPIFFGENPGRITVGTEGFASFYLSRTTSYIIFEYVRRDVVCQAVLYGGQDETYAFRFVRSGYDLAQYTGADGRSIIQNQALSTHLKTMGVPHTRALALSEYRAIIQGRAGAGKDAAAQRAFVAEYAFTSSNHRLMHIHKIVSGMFKRQAEFKDFLRMVVSYITEDDQPIVVSGDRKKIEKWPEDFAAYQEVMRHAPRMVEISSIEARLSAGDEALKVLHAKFRVLIAHHEAQQQRLIKAREDAEREASVEADARQGKIAAIHNKELAAAAAEGVARTAIEALQQQAAEFKKLEIATKAELVSRMEQNKKDITELNARKNVLLGAKADLDLKYEGMMLVARKGYTDHQTAINQQLRDVEQTFAPRLAAIVAGQKHAEQLIHSAAQVEVEALQEQLNVAISDQARAEAVAISAPASPSSEAALKQKRKDLAEARQAHTTATTAAGLRIRAKTEAIERFQQQETVLKRAADRVASQKSVVEALIANAHPPAGSLLSFLREHHPGWTHDVAKVIDPDLLLQTDLSPMVVEGTVDALYSLSVDLNRISTPLFADETAIQRAIDEARTHLEALQRDHESASKTLATLNALRETAQAQFNDQERVVETARVAVATLADEEESALREVDRSRQAARSAAQADAVAAAEKVKALNKARKEALGQLAEQLKAVELDFKEQAATLNAEKAQLTGRLAAEAETANSKLQTTLKELDDERKTALSREGVDTNALQQLEKGVKDAEDEVREAVAWSERVAAWHHWTKNEWPRVATLTTDADDHKKRSLQHNKARTTAEASRDEWKRQVEVRLATMRTGTENSREAARQAGNCLGRFDGFPPDPGVLAGYYEMSWTFEALIGQLNSIFAARRIDDGDLKTRIREIKHAFRSGRGSPCEQYFETIAANIDPDGDQARVWVEPFRQWYDGRHEELLRALLLEAQFFGRLVNGFYTGVQTFDRQIRGFNRDILKALTKTVVFKRISQISVEFVSTVEKKAYWKPIKEFVDTHHAWISSAGHELPPPTFSDGLKRLMEHWEVREGIRADRLSLIDVRGEVVENGKRKAFVDGPSLKELSSNGLSYLILTTICVAFLQMIRGDAKVQLTMAIDELLDLDVRNIGILVQMLRENGIDLVSACPDADVDVMIHFNNRYKVVRDESGPEIHQAELAEEALLYV